MAGVTTLLAFVTAFLLGQMPGHGAPATSGSVAARVLAVRAAAALPELNGHSRDVDARPIARRVEAPPADDENVPEDGEDEDDDEEQDESAPYVTVDAHRFAPAQELTLAPVPNAEPKRTRETSFYESRTRLVAAPRGPPSA
jgi:hypothetical protein